VCREAHCFLGRLRCEAHTPPRLLLGTDELSTVFNYEHVLDPAFLFCLLLSASQAFVLNMCIFRCTSINSPLATSVTGQIKDIATTSLGACALSPPLTFLTKRMPIPNCHSSCGGNKECRRSSRGEDDRTTHQLNLQDQH
jgi:hypothetical protein